MARLRLGLGLQPLPQGEKEMSNGDVHPTNVHLTVLQDLPPRQAKLTNTFTDLLEHLRKKFKGF